MDASTTPLRADAQRNYEKLLQVAGALFDKRGAAPTLENIAKHAGVGIGTLYRHFPTKKALLEAVYAKEIARLLDEAPRLLRTASPDQALSDWLKTIVDYSVKYSGFADFVVLSLKDKDSSLLTTGTVLLAEAQEAGAVRSDLNMAELLRLVHAVTGDGVKEQLDQARRLLSVIVAGLRP